MTKKILYVITDSGVGGSEKVLTSLLNGLDKEKFALVGVVVLKTQREMGLVWEQRGIPVSYLNMGKWPFIPVFTKLGAILKKTKPDIVHAFLFHSVQVCRINHMMNQNYKLVSSPRVNYRFAPRLGVMIDRCLKNYDDYVLCESLATQKFLVNNISYDVSKTAVISNGVDSSEFKFSKDGRDRVRKEWEMSSGTVCVGAVGRLHDQKGFDLLIEALANLKTNSVPHQLVVVGEGPEKSALENLATMVGVNVIFTGLRKDVTDVLSAFDVFVLSSRYEGMPNVLLEAMSIGLPCVSTAVDGVLDIAEDGKNVLLSKPEDSLSLSVAIGLLLERKDLRSQLGKGAMQTAHQHSVHAMIGKYENFYTQVLKNKNDKLETK